MSESIKENISKNIAKYRKELGISQKELAELVGAKNLTTVSSWERGISSPDADTIIKICKLFKISLYDLYEVHIEKSTELTTEQKNLIDKYDSLDPYGKDLVDTVISKELKRIEETNKKTTKSNDEEIVYINFAQNTASAGSGDVLFGDIDDTPLALVENRITNKADFAVRVNGDSMLPDFSNGDIVLASKQPVDNGDIGLFVVNGNGYIKKKGSRELISLNPKFDNVQIGEYDTVYCMGKVIGKVEDEWMR